MSDEYLSKLRKIILSFFEKDDIMIFVFGSRARKDNYGHSDIDIGLLPKKNICYKTAVLWEKIEETNIPYKVDLVDFSEVSDDFKKEAFKDIIIWKE
jgi:uncharacterized protein